MLYFDSSALVKRYIREPGSEGVSARCAAGGRLFISALGYAEILASLGRKMRAGDIQPSDFDSACARLQGDWNRAFEILQLDDATMAHIPALVMRHSIRGADAVHLSAALWVRDFVARPSSESIEFVVSDLALARIAIACGLAVFNPEVP